jgi:small multidrug resistance family-3 protein
MQAFLFVLLAAVLEVGGDALIRWGLKAGGVAVMALGALVLVGYGFAVNMTRWDFGRLLGIYIAIFFVVAQVFAVVLFKERLQAPVWVGGAFIVVGGCVMMLWRVP